MNAEYCKYRKLLSWREMFFDPRKRFKCDINAVERDIKNYEKEHNIKSNYIEKSRVFQNSMYDILKDI
jgi:hypothetical protein